MFLYLNFPKFFRSRTKKKFIISCKFYYNTFIMLTTVGIFIIRFSKKFLQRRSNREILSMFRISCITTFSLNVKLFTLCFATFGFKLNKIIHFVFIIFNTSAYVIKKKIYLVLHSTDVCVLLERKFIK